MVAGSVSGIELQQVGGVVNFALIAVTTAFRLRYEVSYNVQMPDGVIR